MEHTLGPWRVYTNGNGERRLAIQADGDIGVETIADIRLTSIVNLPAEANAKLMAASPDMLNALRGIIRNAGYESGEAEPNLQELSVNLEYLDSAREAIEAATKGEQN